MDSQNDKMTELLDAAAGEALGANAPADSTAYRGQLPTATAEVRHIDRELRETVARLAAASPHVTPPADLRGRILQASAPQTFRMEDYRKAMRDNSKLYRWGCIAAMLFLMAAGYYNYALQSALGKTTALANEQIDKANQAIVAAKKAILTRDALLSHIIAAGTQQVNVVTDGKLAAKAFLNNQTGEALLVVAEGSVPTAAPGKIVLTLKDDKGNVVRQYNTVLVEGGMGQFPAKPQLQLANDLTIQNARPVGSQPIMEATFPH